MLFFLGGQRNRKKNDPFEIMVQSSGAADGYNFYRWVIRMEKVGYEIWLLVDWFARNGDDISMEESRRVKYCKSD